jgi:hypothetical protein
MDSREFLLALFGDAVSSDQLIVVWGKASGSRWCVTVDEAVRTTALCTDKEDVYFGVALQSAAALKASGATMHERTRGKAATTGALGGLWLDIDVAGPGHAKAELPRTLAEARKLLSFLPAQPTVVLATGGGLHAWWMFTEPWAFESAEERSKAAMLAKGWQDVAATAASIHGWTLDRTHDLSRVLRLPGTVNHKHGCHVEVLSAGGPTYNPSDFDVWMPERVAQVDLYDTSGVVQAHGLVMDPDAEPPAMKLIALLDLSTQFEKTWRRKRRDLPSQSEYDLSLASQLSDAGWTEQEIVNALIAHRRDGGADPKLRSGYYAATLAACKRGKQRADARGRLNERTTEQMFHVEQSGAESGPKADPGAASTVVQTGSAPTSAGSAQPAPDRAALLADLSAALGTEVLGLLRYPGDPPTFTLKLGAGDITLGAADWVLSFRAVRLAVASTVGVLLDPMRNHEWLPLARTLLSLAETQDLGDYGSNARMTRNWLLAYIRQRGVAESVEAGIRGRMPFDGPHHRTYIRLEDFSRWIKVEGDVPSSRVLARWLREAGCVPWTVGYTDTRGRRTTAGAWRIASDLMVELTPDERYLPRQHRSDQTAAERSNDASEAV